MSDTPHAPSAIEFALNRAFAAHRDGKLDKAEAGYREVLQALPDNADALHLLGVILKGKGEQDEAERLIKRALELQPNLAAAHYNLGNLYAESGRDDEAIACYKTAIARDNAYPEAYYGLGNMLRDKGDYKAANASFGLALLIRPAYTEARHNRANVLREMGRVEESVTELRKVLEEKSDLPEAHYNLALSLYMLERYQEGGPHYEFRFKTKGFSSPDRKFRQPLWRGEVAPTKTLLLHAEQGLGDTIQFIRYIRHLRSRVGQVVVEVPLPLVRLVSDALGELVYVVAQGKPLPPFDCHLPLLSLVGMMSERDNADVVFPYLKAQPARIEKWKEILSGKPGLKVGLNWQGNPNAKIDKGRSIALRAYEPLFAVSGIRFISLQKHAGVEQLEGLPEGMKIETLGEEFDAGPDAFLDAAAVLSQLDLFITTDTALAHLAGGLNCPTWLLLKQVPDWRWGLSGDVTHWYKSIKIFRQENAGDWMAPIEAMVRSIESWHSAQIK